MRFASHLILTMAVCAAINAFGQDSSFYRLTHLPGHFLSHLNSKTASLSKQLTSQAERYVKTMTDYENDLQKKMHGVDSNAAKTLFLSHPQQQYARYLGKLKTDSATSGHATRGQYLPYVDSMQATLSFLSKNPDLLESSGIKAADVQHSLQNLKALQAKMQDAELIKQYIAERKELIKQYLSRMTHLPSGLTGVYHQYNKQLYYYTQQVQAYKEELNDPDKMMQTALALVEKLPAFTTFMQKNSMFAGLFGVPAGYTMSSALRGLQTRSQIDQIIGSQVNAGGPNAMQAFSQGMQSAQGALDQLKQRLSSLGAGGENPDLPPGFKPNPEKTKTFFQRLETGFNLQTTPSSYFFPATTDLGLSLGYKLTGKSTIGIGGSYKIGWQMPISHQFLTRQGASLRSSLDVAVRSGFSVTGGFEYNYQQPNTGISQIVSAALWTRSGLIGVSKTLSTHSKYFKSTKFQLLWDFLSYSQVPQTQSLKFRIAYSF